MAVLMAALLALQADPLEKELAEILRRLDAAELADREAAVGELEAFAKKAGAKAAEYLKRHAESSSGEVRARVRGQLDHLARIAECRKTLAVFEAVGLPDCRGKTLALYNPNTWWRRGETFGFHYVLGWILSESKDDVSLSEANLTTAMYKRDRTLPEDWDRVKDKHPKDRPLPGELHTVDFKEFCSRLLAAGTKEDFGDFDHFSQGGLPHGAEPALYAFWALQRDEDKLALQLLELSKKTLKARGQNRDETPSFEETLRDTVAGNLRWQSITGANGGEPRAKLLARWRTLEKIAPNHRNGEPREMVRLYAELAAEDEKWKDPTPEQLAAKSPPARAEIWMHRLRDHAATQWSQPGSCEVLGRFGSREGTANPADELVKLGWDALPVVIDRLDDKHPTRCMGFWRGFAPDSYYLLRMGDCCQQIFEAITGYDIYQRASSSGAMVKDGKAASAKEAAKQWWEGHKKDGPEAYYLKGLETPERAGFSAERLLEIDAPKHLPRLLQILEKGGPERRNAILSPLRPHLRKEHRSLLEPILEDPDLEAVVTVARVLWDQCGDDKGALAVIARLKALKDGENRNASASWGAFHLLQNIRTEAVAEGIAALMTSPVVRLRMDAMSCAASLPSRRLAETLVSQFGDRTQTGWSSNYKIRYCDSAADALIRMLDLSKQFRLPENDEERDRTIADLKAWWEKNRDSIDWAAHVRRIDAPRAPKK